MRREPKPTGVQYHYHDCPLFWNRTQKKLQNILPVYPECVHNLEKAVSSKSRTTALLAAEPGGGGEVEVSQ